MEKLIVLNHKMNLEYDEVIPYIERINNIDTNNSIVICPSNIYLSDFVNYCNWGVGAQNIFALEGGNYTGEVSSLQLKSMGVEYSLVGHYERKKYFNENNKIINKKLLACLESNIMPILCFGENGNVEGIKDDLDELLNDVSNIDFIVFAYEPLKVDSDLEIDTIEEHVEIIYDYLYEKFGSRPNIIYGGGVVKKDVLRLFSMEKLNGMLIGSVSSNIDKIEKIIKDIK